MARKPDMPSILPEGPSFGARGWRFGIVDSCYEEVSPEGGEHWRGVPVRQVVALGLLQPRSLEVAVLLTSEPVSNAVVHAGPHAVDEELEVWGRGWSDRLRVEVAD